MNKTDLINAVAVRTSMTRKESEKAIIAMTDAIVDALINGDKFRLPGFGTFEVKERAGRVGRNPKTKEQIIIPPSKVPAHKPSGLLRENIT